MSGLEEKLRSIPPRSIVLVEASPEEDQMKLISDFLKLRQDDNGIYVSSNRPTSDLVEKLSAYHVDLKKKLETGKTCIVDLVSRSVGAVEVCGCIYAASPSELSAAQMAIEKAIEKMRTNASQEWVLLDSLATLSVFNSAGALLHFLHFLIGRLRVLQFNGVFFTVEGSLDERALSTIKQFCDVVIKA